MGTIECSQPASKSSWDSQDFGDISMVLKMPIFASPPGHDELIYDLYQQYICLKSLVIYTIHDHHLWTTLFISIYRIMCDACKTMGSLYGIKTCIYFNTILHTVPPPPN